MTMTEEIVATSAKALIEKANQKEYISGPMPVIPELVENEKLLFSAIAKLMREYTEKKERCELDDQEIYSLFLFIYAKAGETVWHWHKGDKFSIKLHGIFSNQVPFDADKSMLEHYNSMPVPLDMFEAFQEWRRTNPDYFEKTSVHPALPLLDALKWTYRISIGLGIDFLGYDGE
jgi:hypothetical protein